MRISNDTVASASEQDRTLIEFSPMRRAIARRMTESKQKAPHFYVDTEIAMDRVLAAVSEMRAKEETAAVTVTTFLVRACVVALRSHPLLNAVWGKDGLEQLSSINVGVAIALEQGLIAPALLGAHRISLQETASGLADLIRRARSGQLRPPELTEATFTLSNLGMFEVSRFAAIVTPPQVAIIATGRTAERPVVVDGEIVVRPVMSATVSADHRAVDGAQVAAFLTTFKSALEAPDGLDG